MSISTEDYNVAFEALRTHRTAALSLTDWAVLPDTPLAEAVLAKYKAYRTYLRELPELATSEDVLTFSGIKTFDEWVSEQTD